MKLVIALYKYFSWGGLQKDTLRFAQEAARRGYQVTILVTEWLGDQPSERIHVEVVPIRAGTNHGAMDKFARLFQEYCYRHSFDVSLAMNRIPGADFYFVADSCMANWMPKKHSSLALRLLPRYRTYLRHERSICAPLGPTRLLYIAPPQKADFMAAYGLPEERFVYLPPGMDPRCRRPADADQVRGRKRGELGLAEDALVLIEVGTNLWRKGVDRVMAAITALPAELRSRVRFVLAGADDPERVRNMAQAQGVEDAVVFLGPRQDVPELLLAADVMVHPAREEGTGTVLIEGLAAGLPVMCTAACGFSSFVHDATATVVPEPFAQPFLNSLLRDALAQLPSLAARTIAFASTQNFCGRDQVVVAAMEALAVQRQSLDVPGLYAFRPGDSLLHAHDFNGVDNGFATTVDEDGRWTFLASFPREQFRELLAAHRRLCAAGQWLKNDLKRRVTRVHWQEKSFIVKEFNPDYAWEYFSHGRRTWESSQRLRGYTAPCLAWLRDRKHHSYLIFADLGEMGLRRSSHLQHDHLPAIYGAAGQLLALLHEEGVYHADTKTTNFIINDLCPWLERPVLLIDCDDVRFYRTLPRARRVKNLAQFLATSGCIPLAQRETLIRPFLDCYQSTAGLSSQQMDALLDQVIAMIDSGRIAERNCPSGVTFKYS